MPEQSLFTRYKAWVRRNNVALNLFETGLSSATWLLPDRFSDGEFSYEAIHTAIGLISTFHESILSGAHDRDGGDLLLALGVLQQLQVLVELGALWGERARGRNRYDALVAYEALKAGVRGFVLLRSQGRMLLQGGLGNLEQEALAASTSGRPVGGRPTEVFDAFARFREHHCRAALEEERGEGAGKGDEADGLGARGATLSSAEQATMEAAWQGAVGAADASAPLWWDRGACEPATGADPSTSSGTGPGVRPQSAGDVARAAAAAQARSARLLAAAEALHVLRPLIYAATLRRWGRRAWRPWLASLLVDLASRQLSFRAAATSRQAAYAAAASPAVQGTSMAVLYRLQGIRFTAAESEELLRRRTSLLFYLLRDPVFASHTRPALGRLAGKLERVPLVGWGGGRLLEILDGMQQLYSYTSAS
ncbi:hypothetical protein ACKKBG_A33090 [Auxenochlorella protothecoides x Auxenochlorella symbiontica]